MLITDHSLLKYRLCAILSLLAILPASLARDEGATKAALKRDNCEGKLTVLIEVLFIVNLPMGNFYFACVTNGLLSHFLQSALESSKNSQNYWQKRARKIQNWKTSNRIQNLLRKSSRSFVKAPKHAKIDSWVVEELSSLFVSFKFYLFPICSSLF